MGFTYNDITSASMGIKARLTSWQVCGKLRNFTTTVPGKYGVADFGADFDYREITAHCSIYPKHSFTALLWTALPPGLTPPRDFISLCLMMFPTGILWHD